MIYILQGPTLWLPNSQDPATYTHTHPQPPKHFSLRCSQIQGWHTLTCKYIHIYECKRIHSVYYSLGISLQWKINATRQQLLHHLHLWQDVREKTSKSKLQQLLTTHTHTHAGLFSLINLSPVIIKRASPTTTDCAHSHNCTQSTLLEVQTVIPHVCATSVKS